MAADASLGSVYSPTTSVNHWNTRALLGQVHRDKLVDVSCVSYVAPCLSQPVTWKSRMRSICCHQSHFIYWGQMSDFLHAAVTVGQNDLYVPIYEYSYILSLNMQTCPLAICCTFFKIAKTITITFLLWNHLVFNRNYFEWFRMTFLRLMDRHFNMKIVLSRVIKSVTFSQFFSSEPETIMDLIRTIRHKSIQIQTIIANIIEKF